MSDENNSPKKQFKVQIKTDFSHLDRTVKSSLTPRLATTQPHPLFVNFCFWILKICISVDVILYNTGEANYKSTLNTILFNGVYSLSKEC